MNEILITEKSNDYELMDSGEGEKLERFGEYVLRRPDPQAIWKKTLTSEWESADAVFERTGKTGKWHTKKDIDTWSIALNGLTFNLELLPSKHVGVFPEQSANWSWLEETIKNEVSSGKRVSVLNLFGYTGGATLAASRAGAEVVHVDSSKFATDMAHKNLDSSGMGSNKVRFIVDDVRKFVEREISRGNTYDVIIMDPPVYGKGVKKEVWNLDADLVPLLERIQLICKDPLAILLNGYSSGYSALAYNEVMKSVVGNRAGRIASGELAIKDSAGKVLPSGIYSRFTRHA